MKKWHLKNKDKIKEYNIKNRERRLKQIKEYKKNNPDKIENQRLKDRYKITLQQYEEMFQKQNGLCAICNQPEMNKHQNGKIKSLSVDHDHETGEVRSLLCSRCNCGLGNFKDNPEILLKAYNYLLK